MFSDSDSETESVHRLTINEHFAKAYEVKKEREELSKLKEKYGSDFDENDDEEEDSEDAESEDEDGEELTPAVDAAILRTLARIKRKDPSIYEQGKEVFEEEQKKTGNVKMSKRSKEDKAKPLTIRQHALASVLNPSSRSPSPEPLTYVQEQSALRKEAIEAFHSATKGQNEAMDEDGSDDDLLVLREKTKDEIQKEEEEYREFLQREVGEDLEGLITIEPGDSFAAEVEVEPPRKKKKKSKEKANAKAKDEEDQEFLMNYILNRGWIDRSQKRLPTYKEVTTSKGKERAHEDDSEAEAESAGNASLDEDDFDDVVDRFESSYNFRFEEPDAATIARYPRNIDSLVRRQDTARKDAREKRKARKEEELLQKKEEVKRLKALKLKELRVKLERIGREGGRSLEDSKALQDLDLEGDWDPDAHDRQMADIYAEEEDMGADEEKPQWDDDIDITDIVGIEEEEAGSRSDNKKKKKKKRKDVDEDGSGVDLDEMDADMTRGGEDDEEWDGTEEMRKRKLDEYMDELYGMEFNDMAGGIPTRFKYAAVPQQNYALTPVEILLATDSELNQYMSIKKFAPYRKDSKNWDQKRATRLQELKGKLKERGVSHGKAGEGEKEKVPKKRKGKKERMKEKAAANGVEVEGVEDVEELSGSADKGPVVEDVEEVHVKKRRRRHKKSAVS